MVAPTLLFFFFFFSSLWCERREPLCSFFSSLRFGIVGISRFFPPPFVEGKRRRPSPSSSLSVPHRS